MPQDTQMVALDSNALTYLIDALASVNGPPSGILGPAKLALGRTFMYLPHGCCFHVVPTVESELQKIPEQSKRDNHVDWVLTHIAMVSPRPCVELVEARVMDLLKHHNDDDDCRVVAECELSGIMTLITEDRNLARDLAGEARGVRIETAEAYWVSLGIDAGATPNKVPHLTNPLARQSWWKV